MLTNEEVGLIKQRYLVVPVIVIDGLFLLPVNIPKYCMEYDYGLYVIDETTVMEIQDLNQFNKYKTGYKVKMAFYENTDLQDIFESEDDYNVFRKFHWHWYFILKNYLNTENFMDTIPTKLQAIAEREEVFPPREMVFLPFRKQVLGIKVIFIIDSPLFQSTDEDFKSFIRRVAIENNTTTYSIDINSLEEQGVFFIPVSLTTSRNSSYHKNLWNELIVNAVNSFNEENVPVIFVCCGTTAQRVADNVNILIHEVINVPPLSHWDNLNMFEKGYSLTEKINSILRKFSISEIKWIKG